MRSNLVDRLPEHAPRCATLAFHGLTPSGAPGRARLAAASALVLASLFALRRYGCGGEAAEPFVAVPLGITAISDPWRVDNRIGRYFVRLDMPKDAKVLSTLPEAVRIQVRLYERRRA